MRHVKRVSILLERQALTEDPYRKIFKIAEFPSMAAPPIIKIPVPKKKQDAIDIPKYFLKITLRKVNRLAHPKLITIFPNTATSKEPIFTLVSYPAIKPPMVPPTK